MLDYAFIRNLLHRALDTAEQKINIGLLLLGVFLVVLGARLHLIDALSFYVPFYDDWGMGGTVQLYENHELGFDRVFKVWNGHIVFWSKFINFAIFEANQEQWDTQVMMSVNAFIWALTALFLVSLCARHFKDINAAVCALLVLVLWVFPSSLLNALWGVQTHNYLMIFLSVLGLWWVTSAPYSKRWYLGLFCTFAASLTMGGGAMVSLAIFCVTAVRYLLVPEFRHKIRPTLVATGVLGMFSVWLLLFSSGGQEIYKAKSISDFAVSVFKTLSFPLESMTLPSVVLLAPPIILGVRALYKRDLNRRTLIFTLTLFVYVVVIAVAIAYIRGANGAAPSVRYFEFLQLYLIASLLALLALQTKEYLLKPIVNYTLILSWLMVVVFGGVRQVHALNSDIAERSAQKPMQQKLVRDYLVSGDINMLRNWPVGYLPFPSAEGLVIFLDQMKSDDMLHYRFQVWPDLVSMDPGSAFVANGTIRPSKNEIGIKYEQENSVGSYNTAKGGVKATGTFTSQLIQTKRATLMIPVMGYLGYPGLTLSVVDEVTKETTPVVPGELNSSYAELWQEVYVDAPENAFRLVASDNNEQLWFGFAMPRTVGRLTMVAQWLRENGQKIWLIGLLVLLFSVRASLLAFMQPRSNA